MRLFQLPIGILSKENFDGYEKMCIGVYFWVDSTLTNLRGVFACMEVFEHVHQLVKDFDRWRFD